MRTPARPSPGRARPCGRRARAQRPPARRCRSRPSRSRGPAPPARRPRARECGRATTADDSGRRWAWRRWHESCSATFIGSGWRDARAWHLAAEQLAARRGPVPRTTAARSSPSSQPSSFRCDPQPDEFTTTRSTFWNASTSARRERLPSSTPARVHRERAAAALRRRDDLEAVRREHARGGRVHVGKDRALDAAREEADRARARARQQESQSATRRRARASVARSRRAAGAASASAAARPIGASVSARAHAARVGEKPEEQPADEAIAQRPLDLVLDRRARALDESVVANARRARRHAGHAAEAAVEVLAPPWRSARSCRRVARP
mgnify:CR=1 FL=1